MVIQHNLSATIANMQAHRTYADLKKNMEKLSSGYRINRAADDAAGLAISEKLRHAIRSLNQGSENIQDGISMLQVADGALDGVHDILQRMNELAVQSAHGIYDEEDRAALQQEADHLTTEITRIGKTTSFNNLYIFDELVPTDSVSITTLVTSPSAESGYMNEAYLDSNGEYHAAASMDFSGINADNIKYLYDKSFSFTCSQACDEAFKFTMVNSGTGSIAPNASNLAQRTMHEYTIDISGCTTGADIVNAIYSFVSQNLPTTSYNPNGVDGSLFVSHSNGLMVNGSTMTLITEDTYRTETEAKNAFPKPNQPKYGVVDCSEITNIEEPEEPNEFPIQTSWTLDSVINIIIDKMNAKRLNVDPFDISSPANALAAIDKAKAAINKISAQRSSLGSYQNRLEHSYNNNNNISENLQSSESILRDADMAKEMVTNANYNILAQAGQSMLAQANQLNQSVLNLLT